MRRLSVALCLALQFSPLIAGILPVYADDKPFIDVDSSNMLYPALTYLKQHNVVEGYPDGSFQASNKVNRAEAAKILIRSLNLPTGSGSNLQPFRDVRDETQWFFPYVEAAYSAGMITGYPDRTFRPTRAIVRVEGLKMILKAYKADLSDPAASEVSLFPDTPSRPDTAWFQPFVSYATKKNLIDPVASDRFGVDAELTRGEFADMIYRLLYIQEKGLKEFSLTEEGMASFYGKAFYGRKTSAGTTFRADLPMAAHRSLPFGTIVEVVRTSTGHGTLVQIQDRGPFVDGRVIDLNELSFERIATLGTGVTAVKLNVRGSADLIDSQEIPVDAFYDSRRSFGVTLDHAVSSTLIENGIQVITGKISGTEKSVTALIKNKDKKYEKVIEAPVVDGKFTLQLYTPVAGTYTLNLLPGGTGVGEETITVLPQKIFEKLTMSPPQRAPSSFTQQYADGQARLSWEGNGDSLFRIRMGGKTLYVFGATSVELIEEAFRDVVGGRVSMTIEGATMTGVNPMTINSSFSPPATLPVEAVKNEYRTYMREAVVMDNLPSYHDDQAIVLSGTAAQTISSEAWYTLPSGRTGHVAMASGDTIAAGSKFDLRIPITERGTYVVEVNGLDHEAVLNVALYEQGTFPVLENDRDRAVRLEGHGIKDVATDIAAMLTMINRERERVGALPLLIDDKATALAKERTHDMVVRDYVSHTTPDGKTIEDFAKSHQLYGSVAENIAVDDNASAALQGLLRSPAHRAALLSADLTKIGIGLEAMQDGQIIMTQILLGQ